jgi:catechol 2,3-dioxygenase-like lactoylglutathione lyase family enzyme
MGTQTRNEKPSTGTIDMKLEAIVLSVSDVDRAQRFYASLGWRQDADFSVGEGFRVLQFTPPGSPCSVIFGRGVTPAAPGSAQGLYLVVFDIDAARAEIAARGVAISEVFHYTATRERAPGRDPEGKSYSSWASFNDPDGNGWLLQEIKTRLPGRV